MVFHISKAKAVVALVLLAVLMGTIKFGSVILFQPMNLTAGAKITFRQQPEAVPVSLTQEDLITIERFRRPSNKPPLPNPYSFEDFEGQDQIKPIAKPEEVLLAYYGILRDASNMLGFSGGCGTIGQAELPYPYAYQLLTPKRQKEISLKEFEASFQGVGYTTLLQLLPAYAPPDTPKTTQFYMVEVELITGRKETKKENNPQGSLFAYYYGLVTVEQQEDGGWKISDVMYLPEDFLCAPTHGWSYLAEGVVEIVYGDNLHIIDQIDKTEQNGSIISVYATGPGGQYRFDFVRLTNGYDILLHEFIYQNGDWQETSLLTDDWKYLKLSPS